MDTLRQFTALSEALTGFNAAELHGTGMVKAYYDTLTGILGGATVGELLTAWRDVVSAAEGDPDRVIAALESSILGHPKLGPVASNLVVLWYLGQWTEMPATWRARYGASAYDQTQVVSAEAYRQGLVWNAIHAHPMSAKQQGYASWSLPPDGGHGRSADV